MLGISIKEGIGIGDAVQFTSVPENYYRTTGDLLIDTNCSWVFDHNPYVIRNPLLKPYRTIEMWDYVGPHPKPGFREHCYLSLAEKHAACLNADVYMKHPRLYKYEDYPYEKREKVLLHINGKSHGQMPNKVIEHILNKYKHLPLYQVGFLDDEDIGLPKIETKNVWALAKEISECRMFIGMDSGPSWIAACYPDVIVKKLRTKPSLQELKNWTPMEVSNMHSHWDDREAKVYNISEDDVGFTSTYRRI